MARLHIAEFSGTIMGRSGAAVLCPPVAEQVIPISEESAVSKPFAHNTALIRVRCDVACTLAFGASPEASETSIPMSAGQSEYFGVVPTHRLAVVAA